MDSLGLAYEIIDAVDGKTLDMREIAEDLDREFWRVLRGRHLSDGEIGCYLSHYFLWDRIFEECIETAIILEDDAILTDDFVPAVGGLLAADCLWEVILLSAKKGYAIDRVLLDINGTNRRLVRHKRRVGGTVAYMINFEGAEKLLKYCYKVRAPIDWLYAEWWLNGLLFFVVQPSVVLHDKKTPSIITAPPKAWRTIWEHCHAARKRYDSWRALTRACKSDIPRKKAT